VRLGCQGKSSLKEASMNEEKRADDPGRESWGAQIWRAVTQIRRELDEAMKEPVFKPGKEELVPIAKYWYDVALPLQLRYYQIRECNLRRAFKTELYGLVRLEIILKHLDEKTFLSAKEEAFEAFRKRKGLSPKECNAFREDFRNRNFLIPLSKALF
jgi:hypothetical protein